MSHNLYFRKVRPNGCVDFPIQLPTRISRKIMEVDNFHDRLSIIEDYLYMECEWDSVSVNEMIGRIHWMMCREDLILEID